MKTKQIYTFFTFIFLCMGCGRAIPDFAVRQEGIPSGTWMIYEGSLPCADCSEIKTRLEIKIDQENPEPPFIIKQAYIGKRGEDEAVIDHGVYDKLKTTFRNVDATVYKLNPGDPSKSMNFLRVNDDTLKMLDREMKEIRTELNYLLIRKK